jgi:hypothetical protein
MRVTRLIEVAGIVAGTRCGEPIYLLDIVDSWARHVLRLAVEAAAPPDPTANTWGAHDYIAALHIRDRLEHALSTTQPVVELACVAATDELFRRFTVIDESGKLRGCGVDVPLEPWWWQRVPAEGPVAEDLT